MVRNFDNLDFKRGYRIGIHSSNISLDFLYAVLFSIRNRQNKVHILSYRFQTPLFVVSAKQNKTGVLSRTMLMLEVDGELLECLGDKTLGKSKH